MTEVQLKPTFQKWRAAESLTSVEKCAPGVNNNAAVHAAPPPLASGVTAPLCKRRLFAPLARGAQLGAL